MTRSGRNERHDTKAYIGIVDRLNLVALGLEMVGHEVGNIRLVVDDQNLLGLLFGHAPEDKPAVVVC